MATESAREARRRKILERGSDRLAFITGQTRSLPPSTIDSPAPPPPSNRGECGEEEGVPIAECRSETPTERERADKGSTFESREIEPVTTAASSYHPVINIAPQLPKNPAHFSMARIISSSVAASENARLLCALSIAILVVFTSHGRMVKPMYMVLLTDFAILIGRVYISRWLERDEAGGEMIRARAGDHWMDQMSKTLEVLIVLQKVAGAVFADCSLCAVLIICGVSFCTKS